MGKSQTGKISDEFHMLFLGKITFTYKALNSREVSVLAHNDRGAQFFGIVVGDICRPLDHNHYLQLHLGYSIFFAKPLKQL